MGNFLSNLAKGFVRSAVNQVGRDGGRVVSNRLYGDAHSTPYRTSANNSNEYTTYKEMSPKQLNEQAIRDGFVPVYQETSTFARVVYLMFCAIWCAMTFDKLPLISVIPALILIYKGAMKIKTKDTIKMKKRVTVAVYKSDRRYKSGERLAGYTEKDVEINVPSSKEEAEMKQGIGISYIGMATISFVAGIAMSY